MAYQLSMDKSLSIKTLRDTSLSERAIAESLEVSRNTVRRHLASNPPNDTKAPTGKAPTVSEGSDDTKAPTGLGESPESGSKKRKGEEKKGVRSLSLSDLGKGGLG